MVYRKTRVLWRLFGALIGALAALWAGEVLAATGSTSPPTLRVLYETHFDGTNLPPGWLEQGGWTVQGGLRPPSQGGYTCYALWAKETALENTQVEASIVIEDPRCQIGLVRRDLGSPHFGFPSAGTLALLDGVAGQIRIHSEWDGTNPPPVVTYSPLPFQLEAGRTYRLRLWKTDPGHHAFRVEDTSTGAKALVVALRTPTVSPGRQMDAPGLLFLSGAARCEALTLSIPSPANPRLLFMGDSHAEGEAIKPLYRQRFGNLAMTRLGDGCVQASRSAETTLTVLSRLELDLAAFSPEYVLVHLGYNDSDIARWQTNLAGLLARVQATGARPVLGTLLPHHGRPQQIALMNDWIRTSGYRYVDFSRAVSLEQAGLFWDPRLCLADQIHPNTAGNQAMYDRLLADLPEVFAAPPSNLRRLTVPSLAALAGERVRLTVELDALGNEDHIQFSLGFDPAALAYADCEPAWDLPAGTKIATITNDARLGRLGLLLDCAPGRNFEPGRHALVTLAFQSAGPTPTGRTAIRFADVPTPVLVAPLALEACQDGTVQLAGRRAPVAQWPLEGTGREASDPVLDGELLGVTSVPGRVGEALAFDGAGARVAVPASPAPPSLNQLTLAAWAKPSSVTGTHYLLAGECANSGGLFLRLRDGALEAGTWLGGQEQTATAVLGDGAGAWSHLAAVHNGWGWRLYRNGAEFGRLASPLPALDENVEWTLGARRDGAGGLAGLLSDVRLYDRALEPAEIASLSVGVEVSHPTERTMLDDTLPARWLTNEYGGEGWIWTASEPAPVSGVVAHRTLPHAGLAQHYFRRTDYGWPVGPGEMLYAHVYLDPDVPARMVALQWLDDRMSWEHRAYWGDPLWPYGEDTPMVRRCMGRLPPAGRWTRLEVPAAWVGLEGRSITGMSFVLYDGAAAWDLAGIASPALAEPAAALGGPVLLPGGQLQFSVPTHPALATHVFGSSDLDHWTRLTTLAFPFAGGVFVDDPATGPSVRFYRLVQEPR